MKTIQELENSILRKTNKYVYFNDGTHMSHGEFHLLKNDLRQQYQQVLHSELENSQRLRVVLQTELKKLQDEIEDLDTEVQYAQYTKDQTLTTDWQASYYKEVEEHRNTRQSLYAMAAKVYADFDNMQVVRQLSAPGNGIKFIIQEHEDGRLRMRLDPYQLMSNAHSTLSEIFREPNWYTPNGGWICTRNKDIYLYGRSGDYGVFNDEQALNCAHKLFGKRRVYSKAGGMAPL